MIKNVKKTKVASKNAMSAKLPNPKVKKSDFDKALLAITKQNKRGKK